MRSLYYGVTKLDGSNIVFQSREEALEFYEICGGLQVFSKSKDLFPKVTIFIDNKNVDINNVRKDEDIVNNTSVALRKAISKYDSNNTKQFKIKLNNKTDKELIDKLNSVENVQGYIKELIKNDLESKKHTI